MSPSSSSSERNLEGCSSSGSLSSMDEKASKALEAMLREYNEDSVISESFLPHIRSMYHISTEYDLHVPEVDQRSFNPFSNGFGLSVDAFEAGLRFPLHLLVVLCLSH
ncbi:hypothetical protein BHM03_00002986 [Ensete ventricosum]|nr:hypothetical protein BHM03_00002986 [Ensete ventricosum]